MRRSGDMCPRGVISNNTFLLAAGAPSLSKVVKISVNVLKLFFEAQKDPRRTIMINPSVSYVLMTELFSVVH